MNIHRNVILTVVVAFGLAGCTTSSDSSDSWSRSYIGPMDRVFDAVVDVLEDEDYLVDADRAAGRISAEPSRSNRGRSATLFIRVVEKSERVQVDVQTRSGVDDSAARSSRLEASIAEFFHELELRLQGLKD